MSYSFQKMRLAKRGGSIAEEGGEGQGRTLAWMQQVLRERNIHTDGIERNQHLGYWIGRDFGSKRPEAVVASSECERSRTSKLSFGRWRKRLG